MVCALLPATALAASLPVAPSDIELDVGDSYEAFAGKIPQFVVSCAYCGGDLYTATPDARSDYEDISISSSSAGVVTGLGYDFANTTITSDPNHTYEAVTLHFTAAKPGATTITVQYKIYFSIPSLGNGIYSCGDCGYPVRYYGYQGYQTITRRFNVTVNDSTPTAPSNDTVNSIVDGAVVTVNCTNSEVAHADSSYALLNGSFTVGDVQGDASTGYTVGVTVAPDAYVTAYNTDVASGHSLSPASQSGTITLAYNAAAKVWEVQSGKPVTETQYCYIEATAEGAGRISPKGTIAVAEYDDQTFRMVAEPGSVLVDVLVDGVSAGAVSEYTFRSVTRDHTIHAVFQSVTPPTTGSDSAVVLGIALGLILAAGVVVFALRRRNES